MKDFYAVTFCNRTELATAEQVKTMVEIGLLGNKDISEVTIKRVNSLEEFHKLANK